MPKVEFCNRIDRLKKTTGKTTIPLKGRWLGIPNCEPEGRRGEGRYWSIGVLAVDSLWSVPSFIHCPIGPPNCLPASTRHQYLHTYDTKLMELPAAFPPSYSLTHSLSVTLSHTIILVAFSGCRRSPISCYGSNELYQHV